jgi:hypothetical protein
MLRLVVTADVRSSRILIALMIEAIRSSETSVFTRAILRNIPEDGIQHSHRRENLVPFRNNQSSHHSPTYVQDVTEKDTLFCQYVLLTKMSLCLTNAMMTYGVVDV